MKKMVHATLVAVLLATVTVSAVPTPDQCDVMLDNDVDAINTQYDNCVDGSFLGMGWGCAAQRTQALEWADAANQQCHLNYLEWQWMALSAIARGPM